MKKIVAILLMMVMLIMLVVGCVSRQDYDALVVEYDGMRARAESAESDLAAAQAKNSELTSSLQGSQTELEGAKGELAAAQTKNSELTSNLGKSQSELETVQTELETTEARNSELTSSLEKSESELASIKTENEDLEQANEKLKRFTFFKTALCSKEPRAGGEFIPQPGNTFKTNQTVWVYFDYVGWKYIPKGEKLQTNIISSIQILDAEGEVVDSDSWPRFKTDETPWGGVWVAERYGPFEAGNYTIEVEVTDNNSGETIAWAEEFQVVSR